MNCSLDLPRGKASFRTLYGNSVVPKREGGEEFATKVEILEVNVIEKVPSEPLADKAHIQPVNSFAEPLLWAKHGKRQGE